MKSGPTLSCNFGFQLQNANREARFQIHLSPGTKLLDFSRLISDFGFRSPSREEERNRGLQYRISSFRLSLGKKMEIELNFKISDFGVQLSDTDREKILISSLSFSFRSEVAITRMRRCRFVPANLPALSFSVFTVSDVLRTLRVKRHKPTLACR